MSQSESEGVRTIAKSTTNERDGKMSGTTLKMWEWERKQENEHKKKTDG